MTTKDPDGPVDRDTLVTTKDGDGLTYHFAPEFEFEVGDHALIGDTWELFINGKLQEVNILYLEIVGRSREFVVDEEEWYIEYRVEHYDHTGTKVATISLDDEDVAKQPFDDNSFEQVNEALGITS